MEMAHNAFLLMMVEEQDQNHPLAVAKKDKIIFHMEKMEIDEPT